MERVRLIQEAGMTVSGGFTIGFDADQEDIFDRQIKFIEEAAIPSDMVGQLTALNGTPLYARLEKSGRLLNMKEEQFEECQEFTNIKPLSCEKNF